MNFIDKEIENYAFEHTEYEGSLLTRLEKETYEKLDFPQMVTGRIEGQNAVGALFGEVEEGYASRSKFLKISSYLE